MGCRVRFQAADGLSTYPELQCGCNGLQSESDGAYDGANYAVWRTAPEALPRK